VNRKQKTALKTDEKQQSYNGLKFAQKDSSFKLVSDVTIWYRYNLLVVWNNFLKHYPNLMKINICGKFYTLVSNPTLIFLEKVRKESLKSFLETFAEIESFL
jgi:hypothetical protein